MMRLTPPTVPATDTHRHLADLLLALAALVRLQSQAGSRSDPVLERAAQEVTLGLDHVLDGQEKIRIEIGEVQLAVEGMGTNPDFEPLRELAEHLNGVGLKALEFRRGLSRSELEAVLGLLWQRNSGPALARLSGPHLAVDLKPDATVEPVAAWKEVVSTILEEASPSLDTLPVELATAIELHPADPAYQGRVLGALAAAARAGNEEVVADLLESLPAVTLRRLFSPRVDFAQESALVEAAASHLPAPLAVRLLITAARERGGALSPTTQRLLAKLGEYATTGTTTGKEVARSALVEAVHGILADTLAPDGLRQTAGTMVAEPDRVLKLSLESGILEEGTLLAVDLSINRRQIAGLLSLLETVPREDPVGRALRQRLFHPRTVRYLLESSPPDLDALDKMVPACGVEAAPPLIAALIEATERRVRLRLLEMVARYGEAVGPLLVEQLAGAPWYVQRNMLHLLGRLALMPAFDLEPFVRHSDVRVRHEAVALLINDPATQERGLAEGLASRYEPTLRLTLATAAERPTPELSSQVLSRILEGGWSEEIQALGVAAVASYRDPQVLRLLRRLVVGRGLVGIRLAPKSPAMLAAIRGLATYWVAERGVLRILEAARESKDPEVREAARGLVRRNSAAAPRVGV